MFDGIHDEVRERNAQFMAEWLKEAMHAMGEGNPVLFTMLLELTGQDEKGIHTIMDALLAGLMAGMERIHGGPQEVEDHINKVVDDAAERAKALLKKNNMLPDMDGTMFWNKP